MSNITATEGSQEMTPPVIQNDVVVNPDVSVENTISELDIQNNDPESPPNMVPLDPPEGDNIISKVESSSSMESMQPTVVTTYNSVSESPSHVVQEVNNSLSSTLKRPLHVDKEDSSSVIKLNRSRPKKLCLNSRSAYKEYKFNETVVKMIIEGLLTFDMLDNKAFKKMIQLLNPTFTFPLKRTLKLNVIPNLYSSIKANIKEQIDKSKHIVLSIDTWKIKYSSYVTITSHFIDEFVNSKSYVLVTYKLCGNNTYDNFIVAIKNVIALWKIDKKIVAVVAKEESMLNSALNSLKLDHIPCVVQAIHKNVKSSLNLEIINTPGGKINPCIIKFYELISVCRKIVECIEINKSLKETLKEKQKKIGATFLELKKEQAPKWYFTYTMLESFISAKDSLITMADSIFPYTRMPRSDEWCLMEDVLLLLKPFVLFFEELTKTQKPTLGKVIPLLRGIDHAYTLKKPKSSTGAFLKNILWGYPLTSFGLSENCQDKSYFSIATLMDPRFKKALFLDKMYAYHVEQQILSEVVGLLNKESNEVYIVSEDDDDDDDDEPSDSKENLLRFVQTKVTKEENKQLKTAKTLMKEYYDSEYLDCSEDPIQFWKNHSSSSLSHLAEIGLKYSCIPPIARPVEMKFSHLGRIMKQRRNAISPEDMDVMIFLHHNLMVK